MSHYVQFRNQMTNADDEDLMALARDLFGTTSFIVGSGSYEVVQNSPTGMSVLINDGKAYVYSSTLDYHMRTLLDTFAATASKAVLTIDANSSGSTRYDLICIKIDTAAISDANASNIASLVVVKGTPGAGVPATPANYYKLAEITVADGETTITTSEITDSRVQGITMNQPDLGLPAGGNVQVDGADPYRSIIIPAGSMSPTTTAGCASVATVEAGTNDVDYKVLDFDTTTVEYAFTLFQMPNNWDGGTITFVPIWTAASGSGTVCFGLRGRAFANDDAIDQAYGTEQTSTDTLITAGDIHIGPESAAITLAGTPAGGQVVQLKVARQTGSDTLGVDARLIGIRILYKTKQYSD